MRSLIAIISVITLFSTAAWAEKNVAVVKLLKGDVEVTHTGKTSPLKVEDWVTDGAVVKTGEKSFVKLIFVDKSQMNIGPSSEMKIESFGEKDSGVIGLVKGKIRSQVTKDYLQMDKNKSKLFIKTANAVMGVRGTDFMVSTNGQTTSTVLFEGSVAFNRLDERGELSTSKLEDIVDRGVSIRPGEFSVADRVHPLPTVPAVLNVGQREALEKNQNFDTDRTPGNSENRAPEKSVVPPGLSGEMVSNDSSVLKNEISAAVAPQASSQTAQGYVSGDSVKPTNGAYLHVESGVIIPPPPGSVFDPNTNTYIPSGAAGAVSTTGDYLPPQNVEITNDGKVLVAEVDPKTGRSVVTETKAPSPVSSSSVTLTTGGSTFNQGSLASQSTIATSAPASKPNDIINSSYTPSGLNDISNFQRNTSGSIDQNTAVQREMSTVIININNI